MSTQVDDRIEIDSLNILGVYSFKDGATTNDQCQLCRNDLLAPSFDDLSNGNLRINVSVLACKHAFHKNCIDNHMKNSLSCPIDKTTIKVVKSITHEDPFNKKKN